MSCFPYNNKKPITILIQFVEQWLVLQPYIHRYVCQCLESCNVQYPVKIHWVTNNICAIVVDQPHDPQLILGINSFSFSTTKNKQTNKQSEFIVHSIFDLAFSSSNFMSFHSYVCKHVINKKNLYRMQLSNVELNWFLQGGSASK